MRLRFFHVLQAAAIVTTRPILIGASLILDALPNESYLAMPCDVVDFVVASNGHANRTAELFPGCASYVSGENPRQYAAIKASFPDDEITEVPGTAALWLNMGMSMWLALAIHAICCELYVGLFFQPVALFVV